MSASLEGVQQVPPLVGIKVGEEVEAAALLAKSLLKSVLNQGAELEVGAAETIALIVLLLLGQVLLAAVHLPKHCVHQTENWVSPVAKEFQTGVSVRIS